jgi:hypothetical protein
MCRHPQWQIRYSGSRNGSGARIIDQEEVKRLILQELDDVLQRRYHVHEEIDRLAVFLETHNLHATLLSWPDKRERVQHFLAAVGQARNAIRKKKSSEREIKSRWPAAVFDYYSWHDLHQLLALVKLRTLRPATSKWSVSPTIRPKPPTSRSTPREAICAGFTTVVFATWPQRHRQLFVTNRARPPAVKARLVH